MMKLRCANCRDDLAFCENDCVHGGYDVRACTNCNPKLLENVQRFAEAMNIELRDSTSVDTQENITNLECLASIRDIVQEISDACVNQETPIDVRRKAAEAALFLCFLAENYARKGK